MAIIDIQRVSKRKYQQHGTTANQKLGHKIRAKTITRRISVMEAFYIDAARAAEIGVHPKYRNAINPLTLDTSAEAWERRAKQWDSDHDVVRPVVVASRKARKRDKTPRAASTYRAARRNALRVGVNGGRRAPVTPDLPLAA